MDYEPALHEKVGAALNEFFLKDRDLLELDVNERSITHKLAEHLQRQFDGLKVDCEYNRHGEVSKTLLSCARDTQTDCLDAKTVFPDIVVHRRGDNSCNRLVIEVKKSMSDVNYDKKKLRAFTASRHDYNYALGLLLVFDIRSKRISSVKCFRQGKSRPCALCKRLKRSCGQ